MKITNQRTSPIAISKQEFSEIGHQLVDLISGFIDTIGKNPVTTGETPGEIKNSESTSRPEERGLKKIFIK
jgi:aromatic-L-amino-acid/L-tryptophan decarboxylase